MNVQYCVELAVDRDVVSVELSMDKISEFAIL